MEKFEQKILVDEFEKDIELIDEKLEKVSINLNAMHYEVSAGFGFWEDFRKKTNLLIKQSKELWIQKSFLEAKIKNIEQSRLDDYEEPEEEELDEEPTEEEIESALDETADYEEEDKE